MINLGYIYHFILKTLYKKYVELSLVYDNRNRALSFSLSKRFTPNARFGFSAYARFATKNELRIQTSTIVLKTD